MVRTSHRQSEGYGFYSRQRLRIVFRGYKLDTAFTNSIFYHLIIHVTLQIVNMEGRFIKVARPGHQDHAFQNVAAKMVTRIALRSSVLTLTVTNQ